MLKRLLLANFDESHLSAAEWDALRSHAGEVIALPRDTSEFENSLADADGLVLRLGMAADGQLMDKAPHLRYIGMYGTGFGRIDLDAARDRSITVTNVNDYATQSVAELVVAATISHLRNLEEERRRALLGDFTEPGVSGRTLQGQSIGVVGLGRIGLGVARLFTEGFRAKTKYYSRTPKPEVESALLEFAPLEEVVEKSDIVTLHVPATPETSPLLDSELLSLMKPGSTLINTSPNEVVDMDAVERRLVSGSMYYLMDHADELATEAASRLASLPNARVYPPIGYMTTEADAAKRRILVDNIANFLSGTPTNVVS